MTAKTVQEIQDEHGRAATEILTGYHAEIDTIKEEREPEAGAYLDRLTDEQRMNLMREQKTERARESHSAAVEDYAAAVGDYHERLSRRADYLKSRLFKVENADAGMGAVSKTDDELGAALEYAITAGNADMGRAVFVAAAQRGLGGLMARYFDNVDPEARDLYEEWVSVPPAEVLERQREGVDTILPEPDPEGLMPFARANT